MRSPSTLHPTLPAVALGLSLLALSVSAAWLTYSSPNDALPLVARWLSLALTAVCAAAAGLVVGYGLSRRQGRLSIVELSVPIHDVAGKLSEVVGPISVSSAEEVDEWQGVLVKIAAEVSEVVTRLQQSQRDALRSEQLAAVGQLAAGMAHELLNPLTAIKLIVQAAIERGSVKGGSLGVTGRDLEVLHEQILRQERSIRTFLDYARPPKWIPKRFAVAEAVLAAVELARERARRQRVEIHSAAPAQPLWIEGDSEQLRQVFLNLLINAIDAMPEGGIVTVTLREPPNLEAARLRHCSVDVADTGPGLPAGLGERIFEPFVSTKETGMGLGLSISRRIVEMHGGELTASNSPEGGAVFTVRLPVAEAPENCENAAPGRGTRANLGGSGHAQTAHS